MSYRFDPIDIDQIRLTAQLTVGQRIQRLLDARALAVGLIRGRLRRQYPDLSLPELNLKVLEEIERAKNIPPSQILACFLVSYVSVHPGDLCSFQQYNNGYED